MIMMDTDLPIFDRVYLAITCKKLLATAQRSRLFEYCRDNPAAGWAGCRIVCLGSHARLEEVPETLFPPDLKARIRANLNPQGSGSETFFAGIDSVCDDESDATDRGALYHGLHPYEHAHYATKLPMADRRVFVAAWGTTYPARDDWALFNTTKREYVRAGALAELCGKPDDVQPFLQSCAIDLGTALFTRFCYSSDSSTALSHKPVGLDYGKWVGDRFIVSTLERAKKLDEWKDVTDEVIADIKTIYERQYEEA